MPEVGARSASAHLDHDRTRGVTTRDDRRGLTPAQLYCLLAGLALLLAGIFGFIADGSFDTSATTDTDAGGNADGSLQGDSFLGFEVNGWHNVVHIASGLLLLAAFRSRAAAKTVALAFGVVYGLVAVIGLIDGNDVLGFIPVNAADNILHIALSLVGILAAFASPADRDDRRTGTGATAATRDEIATDRSGRFADERSGTTTDPMTGRPFGDRVTR